MQNSSVIPWKMGVEIELLAPPDKSRQDLAISIAHYFGARVRRIFYVQGEPSKVPGTPFFENLTLGFVVEDDQGRLLAQCVDDLTLQNNLNQKQPPQPGWFRIVSDEPRLLRLTMQNADPEQSISEVLQPIAELFGTTLQKNDSGMCRVTDSTGASIAIAVPLPGERERPCELITPPIEKDHFNRLDELLALAKKLKFTVPDEGATHLHFDATPICNTLVLVNLVNILGKHSKAIKKHIGTNENCRRLGDWPQGLFDLVNNKGFINLPWEQARLELVKLKLTKYCDFNLRNLIHTDINKHTFEVRILPVWIDAKRIVDVAVFFTRLMNWAIDNKGIVNKVPDHFDELLEF